VRSGYGFPVAPTDGVLLATWDTTGTPQSYTDLGLSPGYWYYTLFITADFASWTADTVYSSGDQVAYGGSVWMCLAPYALDVTPGSNDAVWIPDSEIVQYIPAGSISSLAVVDHGYGAMLYTQMPAAYKTAPASSTDTGPDNDDLQDFLNVLGFGFSTVATELDDLLAAYDVTTVRQDRLYAISQTLGLLDEMGSSARFQRLRTLNAAKINQQHGTQNGILDLISSATGLPTQIETGYNLLLGQDQSAFADPIPAPWSAAATYQASQQVSYQGVRYTCIGFSQTTNAASYGAQGVTATPNALSTPSLGGITQVKEAAVAPASITIPFTVTEPGAYYAQVAVDAAADHGILTAAINGTAVTLAPLPTALPTGFGLAPPPPSAFVDQLDLYAPSATALCTVQSSTVPLSAGSYTLVLSTTAKNPASSGYSIAFSQALITGALPVYAAGAPPPSAPSQWSATATTSSSTLYANAATGAQGTWSVLAGAATLAIGYLGG
jgi:hypothetical protein